jgi:hypothetical protein
MACFSPLKAYRAAAVNSSGRRSLVWDVRKAISPVAVSIPCGQCVGCRLERVRQWAVRCTHEASLYDDNIFVTITYDNDHLPEGRSLSLDDYQLFLKRVRDYSVRARGRSFRFFGCGEYGDIDARPHYHILFFDFDFSDKTYWRRAENGERIYRSERLERLWPFGMSEIGSVTFNSAAYVAGYVMKKITGDKSDEYYSRLDDEGRIYRVLPEFGTRSGGGRNGSGGIGQPWLDKFGYSVYPEDFLIVNGVKVKPPRFYDRKYEISDPDGFARLERSRRPASRAEFDRRWYENSKRRLSDREQVVLARQLMKGKKL